MSDITDLNTRIERAFVDVKEKAKQQQQTMLQDHLERQKRLKNYETAQARVIEIAKPRLEALAARAKDRALVTPSTTHNYRAVKFEFKSPRAAIKLTFSVAPDREVRNVVVQYDLQILPVLWSFDAHGEFSTPIDAIDAVALAEWLDDRIVEFVELFIKIHESELYDKAEYVEDPIAKVKFPKFAAGATLEHGGQTFFFVDNATKQEFAKQKGVAMA